MHGGEKEIFQKVRSIFLKTNVEKFLKNLQVPKRQNAGLHSTLNLGTESEAISPDLFVARPF